MSTNEALRCKPPRITIALDLCSERMQIPLNIDVLEGLDGEATVVANCRTEWDVDIVCNAPSGPDFLRGFADEAERIPSDEFVVLSLERPTHCDAQERPHESRLRSGHRARDRPQDYHRRIHQALLHRDQFARQRA